MTSLRRDRQRGSAALLGLLFGLAMIAVVSTVVSLAAVHARSADRYRVQAHARAAAESGAAACIHALRTGMSVEKLVGEVAGAKYDAQCSRDGPRFTIESTGSCRADNNVMLQYVMFLRGELAGDRTRYTECAVRVTARRSEQ
jgi:hypothetical protein